MTPKEVAMRLVKPYAERGDSLKSILDGCGGLGSTEFEASIGGYCWQNDKLIYKAKRNEVIVTRFESKDCLYIYKVEELYNEVVSGQLAFL